MVTIKSKLFILYKLHFLTEGLKITIVSFQGGVDNSVPTVCPGAQIAGGANLTYLLNKVQITGYHPTLSNIWRWESMIRQVSMIKWKTSGQCWLNVHKTIVFNNILHFHYTFITVSCNILWWISLNITYFGQFGW